MQIPKLTLYNNGICTAIQGDEQNTVLQWADTLATLRTFKAYPGMAVYVEGSSSLNDGGQGVFVWTLGTTTDDGVNRIVPNGVFPPAYWHRQGDFNGPGSLGLFPSLAAADAYCTAQGIPLLINENVALTGNTTLTTPMIVAAGGVITTGAYTFTTNSISGPEIPLFDTAGVGAILISGHTSSLLGWFNPAGDGTTDDTNPVQRWANSSSARRTWLSKSFVVMPITVPTGSASVPVIRESSLICGGINVTTFISKAGGDVFVPAGALTGGLYYVSFLEMGGFTCNGQGALVGAGYGVHITTAISTGYGNRFFDIDSTLMGGGTVKDESLGGGLFSTTWDSLRGGEGGDHVFNMLGGGPDSVMVNCYGRNAKAGKALFRCIYPNLLLRDCNGMSVGSTALSFWGIFGSDTSPITINHTSGGSVTIPAGSVQVAANTVLENCNIEAFPDVAVLAINGFPRFDDKTLFQTADAAGNFIAVYVADNLGSGIQGTLPPVSQITLVGAAAWTNSCSVWTQSSAAFFNPPRGDLTHDSILVYDFTDAAAITIPAILSKYVGNASIGVLMSATRTKALVSDVLILTPQTIASAAAQGIVGEIAIDANYIYVCTATNTWKRVAVATWP
jgi:hypothetical protein